MWWSHALVYKMGTVYGKSQGISSGDLWPWVIEKTRVPGLTRATATPWGVTVLEKEEAARGS